MSEEVSVIDDYWLTEAMRKYGGGFVSALGTALRLADDDNNRRIKKAFPEYIKKYTAIAGKMQ